MAASSGAERVASRIAPAALRRRRHHATFVDRTCLREGQSRACQEEEAGGRGADMLKRTLWL